jgi:hypothetical protein
VELNPWNTIIGGTNNGQVVVNTPQFVAQQVMLNNQADALARRVDMSVNAYSFPAEFVQQEQSIALANSAASQSVVLTGFRSGEVKSLRMWLTRTTDNAIGGVCKPFKWYLPTLVRATYAGDIYAQFTNSSSPLWYLLNNSKAPAVNTINMTNAGVAETAFLSQWVEVPFAQTMIDDDAHHTLVHGKPITNGIINLDVITPTAQADWVLNVSYVYNTTLLISQGPCDFVF